MALNSAFTGFGSPHGLSSVTGAMIGGQISKGHGHPRWCRYGREAATNFAISFSSFPTMGTVTDTNRGLWRGRIVFRLPTIAPSVQMVLFSAQMGGSSSHRAGVLLNPNRTLQCWVNTTSGGLGAGLGPTTQAAASSAIPLGFADNEGWVTLDFEVENYANGATDEMRANAHVYFADGTDEALAEATESGNWATSLQMQSPELFGSSSSSGFTTTQTCDIDVAQYILIGANNADYGSAPALPPVGTRCSRCLLTGEGALTEIAYADAAWGWWNLNKPAQQGTMNSDTRLQTTTAGQRSTFTHEGITRLGATTTYGIRLFARAQGTGSGTGQFVLGSTTTPATWGVVDSNANIQYIDFTTRTIAAFDALEVGVQSVVTAGTYYCTNVELEVLHDGNAYSDDQLLPGDGYQQEWFTWTGDGTSYRVLTGASFRPHAAILFAPGQSTTVKVATEVGGHYSLGPNAAASTSAFFGFTADGLAVAHVAGHSWNENGVVYRALLIRDDGSAIYDVSGETPVITGYTFLFTTGLLNNATNSNNQQIVFGKLTSFAPGCVLTWPGAGASSSAAMFKTTDMAASQAAPWGASSATVTTGITSFDANGFTLGSVTSVAGASNAIWLAWSAADALRSLVRWKNIPAVTNANPAAAAVLRPSLKLTFEEDDEAVDPVLGSTSHNLQATGSPTTLTCAGHVVDAGADRYVAASIITYGDTGTPSCTYDGNAMDLVQDIDNGFQRVTVFQLAIAGTAAGSGDVVFTSTTSKNMISMFVATVLGTSGIRWANTYTTVSMDYPSRLNDLVLAHCATDMLDAGETLTYPTSPWTGIYNDGAVSGAAAAAWRAGADAAVTADWVLTGTDVTSSVIFGMMPASLPSWNPYFAMAKGDQLNAVAAKYRLDDVAFGVNNCSMTSQTFAADGLNAMDAQSVSLYRTNTSDPVKAAVAWWLAVSGDGSILALSPPTSVDDAYSTPFETQLVVTVGSGVLGNDNTNGGGTMTALLVADVAVGTLSLASDGSFTYSPPGGFSGNVTFTYRAVNDGGVGTIATVTITVGAPPPAAEVESAIVEVGLGGSYRNFWRARAACERFFDLGDCGTIVARDASGDPSSTSAKGKAGAVDGTYSGEPAKGLGLLPEYGLATTFDGDDDYVVIDPGLPSSGAFTLVAMVRPAAGGAGTTRCLVQTGAGAGYLGITSGNAFTFGINGGSKISGGTATAGQTYFVVGTYDGTTAYLYVGTPTSEAVLVASGALAISGHGSEGKIGANNSEEFVGEMQGVVTLSEYLISGEVYSGWLTCEWTDITDDVLDRVPLTIDRGIHSDRTDQRVAATGKFILGLNNSQFNSAGTLGRYSPPNANAVSGFDRGTPIRVRLYSAEEHYPQFIGRIRSIKPDAGVWDGRGVVVVAHDWLEEAAKFSVKEVATIEDLRPDQAVEVIVNAMRNRPHGLSLATSSDTYPIVFDGAGEQKAISEFVKLMNSERGWLYVKGDGTLTMQTRSSRVGDGEPAWTFADTMTDVDPERSTDQLINRVKVTCHPRRVDAAPVVLYEADQSIQIDNGVTVTTFLQYRDPDQEASKVAGLDVTAPVATTDYLINTAADGSGTNLTGNPNFVITGSEGSNGYYFTVTNNYGERAYFTFLRVRGRGIYDYNPVTLIAEDVVAIEEDGLNELNIDLPYQDSATTAQDVASYELALGGSAMPTRVKQLRFKAEANANNLAAALEAEISDRVLVQETVSGVNTEYLINGVRLSWGPSRQIVVTWWLVPADISGAPWIFDVSTFDETTTFGFG